ncbi:hypothetical protein BJ742DRAFT_562405 [Cladochytrium replicatum]|nr:hypothetical protein BJ742DRAFT_562405 [Cladochytrium replicatum]
MSRARLPINIKSHYSSFFICTQRLVTHRDIEEYLVVESNIFFPSNISPFLSTFSPTYLMARPRNDGGVLVFGATFLTLLIFLVSANGPQASFPLVNELSKRQDPGLSCNTYTYTTSQGASIVTVSNLLCSDGCIGRENCASCSTTTRAFTLTIQNCRGVSNFDPNTDHYQIN